MTGLRFEVVTDDGPARAGRLVTAHGTVDTPAFMPVGTAATVKATAPSAVAASGADMVLANTYHLMLRPAWSASPGSAACAGSWRGPADSDRLGAASRRCRSPNSAASMRTA